MLAKKTKSAIFILYEASGYATTHQHVPIAGAHANGDGHIIALLTSAGLLDCNGKLTRPLNHISLYDVLAAVGDGIYPATAEKLDYFGLPSKQRLYHSMFKQMLSMVKVSEFEESDFESDFEIEDMEHLDITQNQL